MTWTLRSRRLILASASPRRRELLAALGVPFEALALDADESVAPGAAPAEAVLEIARRKLAAARNVGLADACLLVADTDVVLDGRVLGKPADAAAARSMLRALRGRGHEVLTAVGCQSEGACETAVVASLVHMREYTDEEIAASIAVGTPFDKAGGYAIQDSLLHPVELLDGCYCNVMGLPLWTVYALLERPLPGPLPRPPDATFPRCASCPLRARMLHS